MNPDTVVAQIESSALFGYSAMMWGEINIAGGRVQQTNFDNYRVARMNDAPRIDAYVIDSSEAPGGIGEPGVSIAGPAPAFSSCNRAAGLRPSLLPSVNLCVPCSRGQPEE